MNDQELERKLHAALEHAAPDDVEAVLARLGPQNGEIIPISAPKRRKRILPWIAAACLALAIGGGVAGVRYQQANAVASVVSLDVNPCVRLEGQRDAGARLSPGDRGGIRAVLLNLALPIVPG